MCGIAGIAGGGVGNGARDDIRRMTDAIVHRGPDEGGEHVADGVVLGIRRLRIIDLLTGGQPISNEDGMVWTVHNGEIYNFRELRSELRTRGHTFRTQSDTECIVHGYEEWGAALPSHLRGMFAIAIWDGRARRLVLTRDRLGKKPLLYAVLGDRIAFASEIQALLPVLGDRRDIDLGALGDYLAYGYVPGPATIFRSIRKLPAGHSLVWDDTGCRVARYWDLRYAPKLAVGENEALERIEAALDDAVKARLIADVPLGALLSGGVDSSTIVALMARHGPVKTFSIGFDDRAYDELAHARRVAERYHTEHHEFVVRPSAAEVLPTLVRHYGEPFADASAIPSFYVSKLARSEVTVVLNGDGGDELFGGYERHRAFHWTERLRVMPGGLGLAWLATRLPFSSQRVRAVKAARLPARDRYARWMSLVSPELMDELVRSEHLAEIDAERSRAIERAYDKAADLEPFDRALAVDTSTYLPYDLLVKMDIASMANSVEARSPFLDHNVVELVARLPVGLKVGRGMTSKYLLKRLARRLVPRANVDRPKMGFAVPIGRWLTTELRDQAEAALLGTRASSRGYIDTSRVRRMWDEHQSGRADHAFRLWILFMLELWHQEVFDRIEAA
jgi:asparagine synthase (glutamine-hydrolysing)